MLHTGLHVTSDLRHIQKTWGEAKNIAQDREKWEVTLGALCGPWDKVDQMITNAHNILDNYAIFSYLQQLTSIAIFDKQSTPVD